MAEAALAEMVARITALEQMSAAQQLRIEQLIGERAAQRTQHEQNQRDARGLVDELTNKFKEQEDTLVEIQRRQVPVMYLQKA